MNNICILLVLLVLIIYLIIKNKSSFANGKYPINFSIPTLKWLKYKYLRDANNKTSDFSPMIPGNPKTYIYDTESEYITGYSKCLYAVTKKKAGWDCLRHYEILIAGTIPYFLNIDNIPSKILTFFPKHLIKEAMLLEGVPSEKDVQYHIKKEMPIRIDHNLFDINKYNSIRQQILDYTSKYVLSSRVVENYIPANTQNIYIHSENSELADYLRETFVIGLLELGKNVYTNYNLDFIDENFRGDLGEMYGKGFIYGRAVPNGLFQNYYFQENNLHNLDIDTYILTTRSNHSAPLINKDLENNSESIILLNGNDAGSTGTFPKELTNKYILLEREFE